MDDSRRTHEASKKDKLYGQPHIGSVADADPCNLLRDLHPITGHGRLCFPGQRDHDRPMSENTIAAALRSLGYSGDDMTATGFRATGKNNPRQKC